MVWKRDKDRYKGRDRDRSTDTEQVEKLKFESRLSKTKSTQRKMSYIKFKQNTQFK